MDYLTIALNKLMSGDEGKWLVTSVAELKDVVTIKEGKDDNYNATTSELQWGSNSRPEVMTELGMQKIDPFVGLGHELAHAWDDKRGTKNNGIWFTAFTSDHSLVSVRFSEIFATHIENLIRSEQGILLRTHYVPIPDGRILDEFGNSLYYTPSGKTTYKQLGVSTPKRIY